MFLDDLVMRENGFDFDIEMPLSPEDARMDYIMENDLAELVESLIKQINTRLKEVMGRNARDADFAVPKEKYPIVVLAQVKWLFESVGWTVMLVDRVETNTENVYGLRFTRS